MGKKIVLDIFPDMDWVIQIHPEIQSEKRQASPFCRNEMTDGVLVDLLSDLDRGITELLDSRRCNLVASDGPKHNVPEVFYWI